MTSSERTLLRACHDSGQMTERQWAEHLADDPLLACEHPDVVADGHGARCLKCGDEL